MLKGLYVIAQRTVAEHEPSHLVVAIDQVNFEKPYTKRWESGSTVMKNTPPRAKGQKKLLTSGYPGITVTMVNLPEPVVTYANWFSYTTVDFVRKNREIERAIRITRAKQLDCHIPCRQRRVHDREVLTAASEPSSSMTPRCTSGRPYAQEKWYLVTSIDDYSRKLLFADFFLKVTTWTHMRANQADTAFGASTSWKPTMWTPCEGG